MPDPLSTSLEGKFSIPGGVENLHEKSGLTS